MPYLFPARHLRFLGLLGRLDYQTETAVWTRKNDDEGRPCPPVEVHTPFAMFEPASAGLLGSRRLCPVPDREVAIYLTHMGLGLP